MPELKFLKNSTEELYMVYWKLQNKTEKKRSEFSYNNKSKA